MNKDHILDRIFIKNAVGELLLLANAYPNEAEARTRIAEEKNLVFYHGIDPTGKDLHLGHVIHLMLLKRLLALGHRVIFLTGDFTARIGDPTDKDAARQPLTAEQVAQNSATYWEQISKILPLDSLERRQNSEWWEGISLQKFEEIKSKVTVQQLLTRDMFQRRIEAGKPIHAHELDYPVFQGYDTVAMDADGEIGGNDQTFNMLVGRDLLKIYKNKEKIVLPSRMLADPATGKKMGKTEGNYIAINEEPKAMFDKIMNSISDEMVELVFLACTEKPTQEIKALAVGDKRTFHEALAVELVSMFHSPEIAKQVQEDFKKIAQGGVPDQMEAIGAGDIVSAIAEATGVSRSDAKRLLDEGAVSVNGEKVTKWNYMLQPGGVLKVGRRFFKVS